jgi:hypothetical protein
MAGVAIPGERWLVNLRAVDGSSSVSRQVPVTLVDFDPRTDTWTVQEEGATGSVALQAKDLISRIE